MFLSVCPVRSAEAECLIQVKDRVRIEQAGRNGVVREWLPESDPSAASFALNAGSYRLGQPSAILSGAKRGTHNQILPGTSEYPAIGIVF